MEEKNKTCHACGAENPEGNKFCEKCGRLLQPANKKSRVNYGILKVLYRSKTRYQNKTARNVGLKKDIK